VKSLTTGYSLLLLAVTAAIGVRPAATVQATKEVDTSDWTIFWY
jgi:hypothetical protein